MSLGEEVVRGRDRETRRNEMAWQGQGGGRGGVGTEGAGSCIHNAVNNSKPPRPDLEASDR